MKKLFWFIPIIGMLLLFTQSCSTGGSTDSQTIIVDVTNPATGRTWMDRNLGASRAATSPTDSLAYGDLYQWGRGADGHQKRDSPTTSTLSSTDQPGHGDFIIPSVDSVDWRSPQNNNLWQGLNGINNPCPRGYRLPTEDEWRAEVNSWGSYDATGAFTSPLRLPLAGSRGESSGSLFFYGISAYYWSGTAYGPYSRDMNFWGSNADVSSGIRAGGRSVRCIKD